MTADQTFVIVGGGLAGAKAAETLRAEGFAGRVLLVGDERERPYERPPLSKGYLLGADTQESVYVHEVGWHSAHDVELRLGVAAVELDRPAHALVLADGERIRYDKLLLATGASPRTLDVPGADAADVLSLRRIEDSDRLRAVLREGVRVVVAGGGWIGLEVAAAARTAGAEVTVIEPQPTPLHAAIGPELGELFADLHREHGVRLLLGDGVSAIRSFGGAVHAVLTSSGEHVPADVVVVGVGVTPNVGLAERAGLEVAGGVAVDASLRADDPDVYAAGDVAAAYHPRYGRRLRVEHWANALHGGEAAARSMLGQDVVYDRLPYFFTDQYELGMEFTGFVAPGAYDRVVYRGDRRTRELIAFWLSQGRVIAGMNVNVWDVADEIAALITGEAVVDPDRLADTKLPLHEVARPQG